MARLLFIVSRGQPDRYGQLKRMFAESEHVDVILDRRHGEGRRRGVDDPLGAWLVERRLTPARGDLDDPGWTLVRQAI